MSLIFSTENSSNAPQIVGSLPNRYIFLIGSIQALEAIKNLLGAGELLTGKMLVFNGVTMKMCIAGFVPSYQETVSLHYDYCNLFL